ncbi:MAG: hypothetical protein JWQ40_75 [Segetibacter sp.]|jgi:hypothetical protein|nr:hypothetical protein [Segetibacter sp.]
MNDIKDERLWVIARKRALFRKNLYSYIVVNIFLWLVWWFTTGNKTGFTGYPWPVWLMLGWGFGIVTQYYKTYHGSTSNVTNKEYERLKREQEGR